MPIIDTETILARLNARDEGVLGEIETECGALVRMIARNILQNEADAEEVAADVLLRIWQTIPPAAPRSVTGYAAMLARHLSINRYHADRAQKRCPAEPLAELSEELSDTLSSGADVSEQITSEELGRAIRDFLAGLPKEDRILFLRRYWYCDAPADAAAFCGITKNAANVRLFRLRKKLKTYLERRKFL